MKGAFVILFVACCVGFIYGCANQVLLEPTLLHSSKSVQAQPDLTKEPRLVWSYKLPADAAGGAILSGLVVGVPTKNRSVWFIDKETGKKLGVYDISGVPVGGVFDGRENLIIAEASGNGEIFSYSLVDGGVNWRFALNEAGELPIVKRGDSDPVGTVLVANRGGSVYALRADDGKPLWNLQLAPLSCPPVWADSIFYLADFEGKLSAVREGKIVESQKEPSAILALLASCGKLFAGSDDSSILCFSSGDGKFLWSFKTDGKVRALAVSDSLVFFASARGTVTACRISDGANIWQRRLEALVSSPLLAAGGAVLAATAEGRLAALSQQSGDILWERNLPGVPVGPAVLDGNTLVVAAGRRVLAFQF